MVQILYTGVYSRCSYCIHLCRLLYSTRWNSLITIANCDFGSNNLTGWIFSVISMDAEGLWILNFTLWADILSTASCVISFSFSSPLVFFLRHILGLLYYIWDIMPAGCFLILHTEWHSFHFLHTYINTECTWKLQLAMFDELCSGLSNLPPLKSCTLFGTICLSYNLLRL